MIKAPALLFTAALLLLGPLSAFAAPPAPPSIGIEQALKLAQDHLNERGLAGEHYITGLTLEDSTLTGGVRYWFARWVPAIKVEKTSETGLQIAMDGTLARVVTGGANGAGRPDAPGVRRVGARNIR